MSYILDALRKADAERERDPARGIHAQPAAGVPVQAAPRAPRWAWAAGLVLLALVAGYGLWQRGEPPPPAAPPMPVTGFVKQAPPPPAVVPVATVVVPPAPPAPVPAKPAVAAVTTLKAPPAVPAAAPVSAAAPPAAPVAAVAPVAPVAAAPAPARIWAVAELPADVQRELPKLAISGGVHSDNAAQRLLIVGGQVMTEGAELAPGVVLDQIRPRTAVLRFKGFRYSVPY